MAAGLHLSANTINVLHYGTPDSMDRTLMYSTSSNCEVTHIPFFLFFFLPLQDVHRAPDQQIAATKAPNPKCVWRGRRYINIYIDKMCGRDKHHAYLKINDEDDEEDASQDEDVPWMSHVVQINISKDNQRVRRRGGGRSASSICLHSVNKDSI